MSIQQYFRAAQQLARELEPAVQRLDDARQQLRHPTFSSAGSHFSPHHTPAASATASDTVVELERGIPELEQQLAELRRAVQFLQGAVDSEGRERRELWRSRVQSLLQEVQAFNAALTGFRRWRSGMAHEANRRSLLDPGHGAPATNYAAVGAALEQQESLLRSRGMIEEQVQMGREALDQLAAQRRTLRSAKGRLGQLGRSLGLSGSIIRAVERQEASNRLITYGGMLAVLLLIGFVYWAVQPAHAQGWGEGDSESSLRAAEDAAADLLVATVFPEDPLDRPPPSGGHGRRLLYL